MAHLLVFGPGYTATPIMEKALKAGWDVSATYRDDERKEALVKAGITPMDMEITNHICPEHTHILVTPAPKKGCPILEKWESCLKQQTTIQSISYLSSTNVYGDHAGGWVDETTPTTPSLSRGFRRLEAEKAWQDLAEYMKCRIGIFRLAGIYGHGRNALRSLKVGKARCIIKENQIFSRIHVTDICEGIWAFLNNNSANGIYNLADNEPCAPHIVIEEAANLLGIIPPSYEEFKTAEMSDMARSFYMESKRVKNDKIKALIGTGLRYPSYKVGLRQLLKDDNDL